MFLCLDFYIFQFQSSKFILTIEKYLVLRLWEMCALERERRKKEPLSNFSRTNHQLVSILNAIFFCKYTFTIYCNGQQTDTTKPVNELLYTLAVVRNQLICMPTMSLKHISKCTLTILYSCHSHLGYSKYRYFVCKQIGYR